MLTSFILLLLSLSLSLLIVLVTAQSPTTDLNTFYYGNQSSSVVPSGGGILNTSITQKFADQQTMSYALQLKYLTSAFYRQGQGNFTDLDFISGGFLNRTYGYIGLMGRHETAHADFLNQTILQLNATPPVPCIYDFSVALSNVSSYARTAAELEDIIVSAYDYALGTLNHPILVQALASITTVNARHAAFIKLLVGQVSWNDVTDPLYSGTYILNRLQPYFKSCPQQMILPANIRVNSC